MNENTYGAGRLSRFRFNRKYRRTLLLFGIMLIIVVIFVAFFLVNAKSSQTQQDAASANGQVQLAQPIATQPLNRIFNFAVKDKTGKVITNFEYKLLSAELRNEIIINGQKYHPIVGTTILVLILEVTNTYTQPITIQPENYIRISMDNLDDMVAPDILNDPVTIQAIATKDTRVALAIKTTDKDIILHVGEITGPKTTIPLTIHYE